MKKVLFALLVGSLSIGPLAGASTNVGVDSGITVKVRSASVWTVDMEGGRAEWSVGGIWAPTPSVGKALGEYRAEDARATVQDLLASHHVTVEADWFDRQGEQLSVRLVIDIPAGESLLIPIEAFEGGSVDLAVLLAWHGLALCERTTAENNEHADKICAAEREARRYARGIHDGGFANHDRERLSLIDIGRLGEGRGQSRYSRTGRSQAAPGGSWWTVTDSVKAIRHSPTQTIRDHGRSMGLPPDSSSRGL